MKTNNATLKKWIEDADKLTEHVSEFPEEVQEVVSRLASVIRILAYENIGLNEERLDYKVKYGKAMKYMHEKGLLEKTGVSTFRR